MGKILNTEKSKQASLQKITAFQNELGKWEELIFQKFLNLSELKRAENRLFWKVSSW